MRNYIKKLPPSAVKTDGILPDISQKPRILFFYKLFLPSYRQFRQYFGTCGTNNLIYTF